MPERQLMAAAEKVVNQINIEGPAHHPVIADCEGYRYDTTSLGEAV